MTTSVLIVGGGLVGTSSAYFAAREGLNVTLLTDHVVPGPFWMQPRLADTR